MKTITYKYLHNNEYYLTKLDREKIKTMNYFLRQIKIIYQLDYKTKKLRVYLHNIKVNKFIERLSEYGRIKIIYKI